VAVYRIEDDTLFIEQHLPVDGSTRMVNSLVIPAQHPTVVDTCYPPLAEAFLADLRSVLDPARLAYVAITHADPDHTGALVRLLQDAPDAKVLTNEMGRAKLVGDFGLPAERFKLVNPGGSVDLGDRTLTAYWVPLFDQPETMGFLDERTRVLHSSDCFGAVVPEPVGFADEMDAKAYREGFLYWNQSNHHWVRLVDPAKFALEVHAIRQLEPRCIVSSHGPAIRVDIERALGWLEILPSAEPFAFPTIEDDG
jgi:flavorubredoxin